MNPTDEQMPPFVRQCDPALRLPAPCTSCGRNTPSGERCPLGRCAACYVHGCSPELQAAVDAWVARVVELGYVQAWGPLLDRQASGRASCDLQAAGNAGPAMQTASCDPSAQAGEQGSG